MWESWKSFYVEGREKQSWERKEEESGIDWIWNYSSKRERGKKKMNKKGKDQCFAVKKEKI